MSDFLFNYMSIAIFMGLATALGLTLLVLPFLFAPRNNQKDKLRPYECGFEPFDDARMPFDVQFYMVAILFIIFDLEIAFLFPWAAAFDQAGLFGFVSVMIFLAILTVGFIYEWRKGALEWN